MTSAALIDAVKKDSSSTLLNLELADRLEMALNEVAQLVQHIATLAGG